MSFKDSTECENGDGYRIKSEWGVDAGEVSKDGKIVLHLMFQLIISLNFNLNYLVD